MSTLVDDPSDISQWNALIKSKTSDSELLPIYSALLLKYPYLDEYWRAYSIAEFKVNGIEASINVLERAVKAHPYSVDLWTDYLTALISQKREVSEVRSMYLKALELNGNHFHAHPLWDKAIEYEKLISTNSRDLLLLYKRVVKVPLYQYAQYYKLFSESAGDFDQAEILEGNGDNVEYYLYNIYLSTLALVNDKWVYESTLVNQSFTLDPLPDEEQWIAYLDHEIQRVPQSFELIESIFNRCLVVHCFNVRIWLKYVAFANKYSTPDMVKKVYEKSARVLPLTENTVRFSYAKFLMKSSQQNEAVEYLLSLVKLFARKNMKHQFLELTRELLSIWRHTIPDFSNVCKKLIDGHLTGSGSHKLLDEDPYLNTFADTITDDSVAVVQKFFLENTSVESAREFYNQHQNTPCFQRSVFFWKFFLDLESTNHANLSTVIQHIRLKSCIPKQAFDALIRHAYDLVQANYSTVTPYPFDESILLTKDNDLSNSLVENYAARARLAGQNHIVRDIEQHRRAKGMNVRDDEFMKLLEKHAGHPGILVDAAPEITNPVSWIGLKDPVVPPFPTFKNVEKANKTYYRDEK